MHIRSEREGRGFESRTGMVKNTSVRARRFIADALRGFPFKGVGDSREKVRFRLVKGHQKITDSIPTIRYFFVACFSSKLKPFSDFYHSTNRISFFLKKICIRQSFAKLISYHNILCLRFLLFIFKTISST